MKGAVAHVFLMLALGIVGLSFVTAARIPPAVSTGVLAAAAHSRAAAKNDNICSVWEDCYTNLFQEDIKTGETGPCVDVLQAALDVPQPSGVYDEATQERVKKFEEDEKLTVQVDIGTKTWDAVGRLLLSCDSAGIVYKRWAAARQRKAAAKPSNHVLRGIDCTEWASCEGHHGFWFGNKGECVKLLQQALEMPQITGVFDETTVIYVLRYQNESGLPLDPHYVSETMWKFFGYDYGCISLAGRD